mgnify:CR=1 FL=1
MNIVEMLEKTQVRTDIPKFKAGDSIRVMFRIVEGDKERTQPFEGVVIARKGGSSTETFTVRKISYGIGVERVFPLNSPRIEKIEVLQEGKVRRGKLYYLRSKRGKAARIKSLRKKRD